MKKMKATVVRLFAAAGLAVTLGVSLPGAAQAQNVVPAPSWNEIFAPWVNHQSNTLCVDVPSGSNTPGLYLQLFHCHGYASNGGPQRWQFIFDGISSNGHPTYQIKSIASGLCLGFDPATFHAMQWFCDSSGGWELWSENSSSADETVALVRYPSDGVANPLCLTAGGAEDNNGEPLLVAGCFLWVNSLQFWQLG